MDLNCHYQNKSIVNFEWYYHEIPSRFSIFNQFVPNAPFLYHLKAWEKSEVFWCFRGVEKGCIGKNGLRGLSKIVVITMQTYCQYCLPLQFKLKQEMFNKKNPIWWI